jgi:hypothetical protein
MPTVMQLLKNELKQQELKNNIAALAITNADEIVAREVLRSIKNEQGNPTDR